MTHDSPVAVGSYRVTAMLTTLPYNRFQSFCANTILNH